MYSPIPQGILHKHLSPSFPSSPSSIEVKALVWPGLGPEEQQLGGANSPGRTQTGEWAHLGFRTQLARTVLSNDVVMHISFTKQG